MSNYTIIPGSSYSKRIVNHVTNACIAGQQPFNVDSQLKQDAIASIVDSIAAAFPDGTLVTGLKTPSSDNPISKYADSIGAAYLSLGSEILGDTTGCGGNTTRPLFTFNDAGELEQLLTSFRAQLAENPDTSIFTARQLDALDEVANVVGKNCETNPEASCGGTLGGPCGGDD